MTRLVFISDTHGARFHSKLVIPPCDVLIHSGDIGGRTTTLELTEFLIWLEKQPAKKKIWIAGNHDLVLDVDWVKKQYDNDNISGMIAQQLYDEGQKLLSKFNVTYLLNSGCEYNGIKFWGSPYTPSFHRQYWAFNLDRGEEIKSNWDLMPNDIDVLITHGPPKGILDLVKNGENVGCEDLREKVLEIKPKIHAYGHIHESHNFEIYQNILFINSSILQYEGFNGQPIVVDFDERTKIYLKPYSS